MWKGGGSRKGAFLVGTPPSAMPELARVRGLSTSLFLPPPGTDEGCGLNIRGQVWQLGSGTLKRLVLVRSNPDSD